METLLRIGNKVERTFPKEEKPVSGVLKIPAGSLNNITTGVTPNIYSACLSGVI